MGRYTDLLYARPSFLEGMARVADIGGTLQVYNESPTPAASAPRPSAGCRHFPSSSPVAPFRVLCDCSPRVG